MIDRGFSRALCVGAIVTLLAGCGGSHEAPGSVFPAQGYRNRTGSYGYCPQVAGGTGILPDGDFSQALNPGNHNLTLGKRTVFASGWKVSKGNIDFNGTTYWNMDGLCSVDLDGYLTVGGIKSSGFRAKRGTYTLTFVMSGNGHCGTPLKIMQISIDKQFTTMTWNTSSGNDVQDGVYATEQWTFRAKPFSILTLTSQDPKGTGCGIVIAGLSIKKS